MAQPFIGEIRMFAGTFAPLGWLLCNGQLLPISENPAMFELIGTTYGGDGQNTFAVPNLQSRIPISMGSGPGLSPRVIGETAGEESVTLLQQQLPAHSHALQASANPGTATAPAGNVWAEWDDSPYATTAPGTTMDPASLSTVGGSQPHENRAPFLAVNFIIAVNGIFPTQS
jgi:microcystin-dependent protein